MNVAFQAHRIEATLTQDGTLTLDHLPFQAGERVEVLVLPNASSPLSQAAYSLRGTPARYQEPFAPVAEQDWDCLA